MSKKTQKKTQAATTTTAPAAPAASSSSAPTPCRLVVYAHPGTGEDHPAVVLKSRPGSIDIEVMGITDPATPRVVRNVEPGEEPGQYRWPQRA